jgi:CheY-like chemotaxis protein
VQSAVGVGSVFWIELGTAEAVPMAALVPQGFAEPGAARAQPEHMNGSVLYIEDNQANMELVAQILAARPNLQLITSQNGAQGIDMARTGHPQVILMDINLPGISGMEALEILRQDAATKHIPVLAISANAMPLDIVKGLQAGFFRYLTKPIKIVDFLSALDLALTYAQTGQSNRNE